MADEKFQAWLDSVDAIIKGRVGLSREDLPDIDYHSLFMAGRKPDAAAKQAIRNAKEY